MIKANELRIGNWLNRNDMDGHFTVRAVSQDRITPIHLIHHDSLRNVHYTCECTLSELEPIPLTPEILEKCGAVADDGWQFKVAISALWIKFRFNAGKCYSELGPIYLGDQIQYMHQLQNLKFSLTGTELEVQL